MSVNCHFLVYAGVDSDLAEHLRRSEVSATTRHVGADTGQSLIVVSRSDDRPPLFELSTGELLVCDGDMGQIGQAIEEAELKGDASAVIQSGAVSGVSLRQVSHQMECILFAEWSGCFPIYYAALPRGVLISNSIGELQAHLKRGADVVGILQFLSEGFFVSDRTCVEGVKKLSAGQRLKMQVPGGRCTLVESSRLWSDTASESAAGNGSPAEQAGQLLRASVAQSVTAAGRPALMMSGGWDSRTLLGFLLSAAGSDNSITCYFHGDLDSRESEIVNRVCGSVNVALTRKPITAECFQLDWLQKRFRLTGNIVFPHWHWAGETLANAGTSLVFSGVYGEVLGGHYGRSVLYDGFGKARAVFSDLLGAPNWRTKSGSPVSGEQALAQRYFRIWPWSLDRNVGMEALGHAKDDLDATTARLLARGVPNDWRLVEAFVSEHRGGQFIAQQSRSCRPDVDIAIPLADPKLLAFATGLGASQKIHNRLNRELLRIEAPGLLRYPLAATLVAANRPIIVQEASRAIRSMTETMMDTLRGSLPGLERPRYGWANFEAVRRARVLEKLADGLQSEVWNKSAIAEQCIRYSRDSKGHSQPLMDQMMKILTLDWTINAR